MQNKIVSGILVLALVASALLNVVLIAKVAQQAKQLKPAQARQDMQNRQKALYEKFAQRYAQDRQKYTPVQLSEAEKLMGIGDQKWGSPEAVDACQALVKKFPDSDRAGCAMLYLAQMSQGDERAKYLQGCIDQYNDCFYGDGVQVGAYTRFLLAQDYQSNGDTEKAKALFNEIKANYPNAIDHNGNLLVDLIKAGSKTK